MASDVPTAAREDGNGADRMDWAEVYRHSLYAFADPVGDWRGLALDGDAPELAGLAGSLCLITAWNPDSREMPLEWNREANRRLAEALDAAGVPYTPAWGGSLPGVEPAWREDGFALHGLGRESALEWGRRARQRALVWLEPGLAGLLFCADGSLVRCGVREMSVEPG